MDKNTDKNDEDAVARIVRELNGAAFCYPGAQKAKPKPRGTPPTANDVAFAYPRSRRQ
jgi:hypothetical protein